MQAVTVAMAWLGAAALAAPALGQSMQRLVPQVDRLPAYAPSPYDRDLLYPSPITLYGRLNAGLRKPDLVPRTLDVDPCGGVADSGGPATSGWRLDGVERSRLGLQADEVLDAGLRAHMQLEQSLKPDSGELLGPCGLSFDARATVGLSDRRWGRVDLGRMDQAAWLLALEADPWRGNGTASPDWRSYVAPERGATRSQQSITLRTPEQQPLQATLQLGRPQLSDNGYRWGGSLVWNRLPLLVGVGWQRWPGGAWALPLWRCTTTGSSGSAAPGPAGVWQVPTTATCSWA